MNRNYKGFYIIEGIVSILIFSIGILGVIKIQANSITSIADGQFRITAISLSNSLLNQMLLDKNNINSYLNKSSDNYKKWQTSLENNLPGVTNNPPQITIENQNYGQNIKLVIYWVNPTNRQLSNYENTMTVY